MFELKNIIKEYNNGEISFRALNNVSLKIDAGEFVAIMGPSGSGKSTLLHILGFLDKPDSGQYILDGQNTSHFTDTQYAQLRKDYIGFVFQQFHLLPRITSIQNIHLPLIYSGKKQLKRRAYELLEQVGLKGKETNNPNELSGGERQRVAIARSLVNDPLVIMADEPTGNLDSKSEKDILKILQDLNDQGKTIIVVTHEEDIGKQAKRIIRLKDGEIVSDEVQVKTKIAKKGHLSESKGKKPTGSTIQFMDYIKQSFQMIFANKVRSFLSMLGIVIGVCTVVAMLALGAGAKVSISSSLSRMGTNLLMVVPNRGQGTVPVKFTIKDVDALKGLPMIKRVAPQVSGGVTLIAGNKNLSSYIQGSTIESEQMRNRTPEYGRYFNQEEIQNREKVAVIGKTVATELFGDNDPLNQILKINKINFRIIGVLPALGGGTGLRDQDNVVYLPLSTAMFRVLGKQYYDQLDVEVKDIKQVSDAQTAVTQLITKMHNLTPEQKDSIRIMNMAELQEALMSTVKSLTFLLGFIASLSLLVGGIGIMNIMLVSVTERTREIGLRKAIGARKIDILMQFITEAVIMTFTGGMLGILLGVAIATILSKVAAWTIVITPSAIIISTSFSITIGLIFGIWPAKKASNLNPIEALRYE
ncbi:MAG: ABC transporter permease [Candidatus Margulisbacteria bacterium]|nr:ABC transporter permease [Candidatus Margulisiibacteriota bacterium]